MTASAPHGRSPRIVPAGRLTRLGAAHPTTVLRWLRAGVLAMVATTALLYLVVSTEAAHQIAAARRTERAIGDIETAHMEAKEADKELGRAFGTRQVALIGTGTEFANHMARVNTDVTNAATGNAAGKPGLTQIQFVQGQLTTCQELANAAVLDSSRGGQVGDSDAHHALTDPQVPDGDGIVPDTGGLTASLDDLKTLEQGALTRQRHSHWLTPVYTWSLFMAPTIVMLPFVLASGYVVARHFRRYVGPGLGAALLATAAVAATAAVLGGSDEDRLAANPLASHPVTLTVALAVLAGAAVLTYRAYRPRLIEYRFPRS